MVEEWKQRWQRSGGRDGRGDKTEVVDESRQRW